MSEALYLDPGFQSVWTAMPSSVWSCLFVDELLQDERLAGRPGVILGSPICSESTGLAFRICMPLCLMDDLTTCH